MWKKTKREASVEMKSNEDTSIPQIQERILANVSLQNFLDIDRLQRAQDNVAKFTNLGLVTVDSKGLPITKETNFTHFCTLRRAQVVGKKNCFFSDAYGGLKAANTGKPYVYICPGGLMDCAVPLIVHDHYFGAVLIGQVRCDPRDLKELKKVESILPEDTKFNQSPEVQAALAKIPTFRIKQLRVIGYMFLLFANEMIEKQLMRLTEERLQGANNDLQQQLSENQSRMIQEQPFLNEDEPAILLSMINSIGNTSAIEGANQTNELACLWSEILNYLYQGNSTEMSPLTQELQYMDNFLKIQSMCYPNVFEYHFHQNCSLKGKQVPHFILYPFIENALFHALIPMKKNGQLNLSVDDQGSDFVITIKDNGRGMPQSKFQQLLNQSAQPVQANQPLIHHLNITWARRRMISLYGPNYDIKLSNEMNEGFTVRIKVPNQSRRKENESRDII